MPTSTLEEARESAPLLGAARVLSRCDAHTWRVVAGVALAFALGCDAETPVVDAGTCPVALETDASVAPDALADRFLGVRSRAATETCRCANDVPYCLSNEAPEPTDTERACLASALDASLDASARLVVCLESAVEVRRACDEPLACSSVTERRSCTDRYESAGVDCFACTSPGLGLAIASCLARPSPP